MYLPNHWQILEIREGEVLNRIAEALDGIAGLIDGCGSREVYFVVRLPTEVTCAVAGRRRKTNPKAIGHREELVYHPPPKCST
jgi:hypothetical protein